eukprot:TRINITY_DN5086_c0_g1_i5.p1 TRINITY_DN5086_c0_g1~~TRINITY_DN5086_c0_g1_i5.p1  ORF type:complete len:1145 (-),score=410.23 TRINITY_DN5086_c0_g1_i5:487-3921(-)
MDLAVLCEVLKATQLTEGSARKEAEQKLDEAVENTPDQLASALCAALGNAASVAPELRQEAAVLLRQLVVGVRGDAPAWTRLQEATKAAVKSAVLGFLENDPVRLVKKNAGDVISAIATTPLPDGTSPNFAELNQIWPELLPKLMSLSGPGTELAARCVAILTVKGLVGTIGDGLLKQGAVVESLIETTLTDQAPEVVSAGVQLVLNFVECVDADIIKPLAKVLPKIVEVLQAFAKNQKEEELKDCLTSLISAADEEAEFFKDAGMQALWATLVEIAMGREAFADEEVPHSAMEACMSLVTELADELDSEQGKVVMKKITEMNIEYMLDVEENLKEWTEAGKEEDEDDLDATSVSRGEENMDQLGEKLDEDVYFPVLFQTIREALSSEKANWKTQRACVMAVSQVVEHIEEEDGEAWVKQCLDFVLPFLPHEHARVRYAAFWATAQICYDHDSTILAAGEEYEAKLLEAFVAGMEDVNPRVAVQATRAFGAYAEIDETDPEVLRPFMPKMLEVLFKRLAAREGRAMEEACLEGVSSLVEVAEEEFNEYYPQVMPLVLKVIENAQGKDERTLRAKAIECMATIGEAVSPEVFSPDAPQAMRMLVALLQGGFEGDDPVQEAVYEATATIAKALGTNFKPFVTEVMPSIMKTLGQKPEELNELDEEDAEDMSLQLQGGKMFGLKTTTIERMEGVLEVLNTIIEATKDEYCDYLRDTCAGLLPLLDFSLSEGLQKKAFQTWQELAGCAKKGMEKGKATLEVLLGVISEFLKKVLASMAEQPIEKNMDTEVAGNLQVRANGISGMLEEVGEGFISKEIVKDVALVLVKLLSSIELASDEETELDALRRKGVAQKDKEDSDDEEEEDYRDFRGPQSVRYALADALTSLLKANKDAFVEVVLPDYMKLVVALIGENKHEADRGLGFYIADDVVEVLKDKSVPYWNGFMNQALNGVTDKSALVRQYATSTIGNGAECQAFHPMAQAAASQVFSVLQKQGERYRRRRAMKMDQRQTMLSVDACIRAMGQICEFQEAKLGEHAAMGWKMWLQNLPVKYDVQIAQKVHTQLLSLAARNHPFLGQPENMVKALSVFADTFKSKTSTKELDKAMATAVSQIGEDNLKQMCSGFTDKQQKKVESMVSFAKKQAAAAAA